MLIGSPAYTYIELKAILIIDKNEVKLVDLDYPTPRNGEVTIRMIACGLCGTDVEKIKGEYKGSQPVIGHEAVGIIEDIGGNVTDMLKGMAVVPHHHVECGSCYYCLRGSETMCPEYRRYNFIPGGFSEFFKIPSWIVSKGGIHILPSRVKPEEATLTEPLACCIRALKRVGIKSGINALILGLGPIGILFVKLLKHYGAESIIGYDLTDYRLRFAERAGAKIVTGRLPEREILSMSNNRGVDLTIVATGSLKGISMALDCTRPGGTICLFGLPPYNSRLDYDISRLVTHELSIIPSNAATEAEMKKSLNLINDGLIKVDDLITHKIPLDRFDEALEIYDSKECEKIIITP